LVDAVMTISTWPGSHSSPSSASTSISQSGSSISQYILANGSPQTTPSFLM
jgi:hypothetical protein